VGRAERSGGLAMSPPGTSRGRSQNYLISIIYRVRATGLDKGGEGQENYFSKISDSSHLVWTSNLIGKK
jgi:hypothetical protein